MNSAVLEKKSKVTKKKLILSLGQAASVEMERDKIVNENGRFKVIIKSMLKEVEKLKRADTNVLDKNVVSGNLSDLQNKNKDLHDKLKKANAFKWC